MKIPDLTEVEAWSEGAILKPGSHNVRCVEAEEDETGTPSIEVQLEAIDGPEAGSRITDWIYVTPNSLGRVKQIFEAFGVDIPKGDWDLNVKQIIGADVRILVREEPNNEGKMRSRVKAYLLVSDIPADESGLHEQNGSPEKALPF